MLIAVLILTVLLSIVVCHLVAQKRGASPVFWGVMGGIFGPLAIPFVLFAKPKNR
jgi:hypothetical protein